jgi:hypothetical protein
MPRTPRDLADRMAARRRRAKADCSASHLIDRGTMLPNPFVEVGEQGQPRKRKVCVVHRSHQNVVSQTMVSEGSTPCQSATSFLDHLDLGGVPHRGFYDHGGKTKSDPCLRVCPKLIERT